MWGRFILLSLLAAFLAALLSGTLQLKRGPHAGAPLDTFQDYMGERIPALMKLYRIPGCNIALVQGNKIVWTQGFGYADLADSRSMTADTPMSVQSISKSVTAWGVLKLVENGLINLDAPVSKYLTRRQLPQSDFEEEVVTIRRLLSHTAGMPLGDFAVAYSPGEKMPSLQERLAREAVLIREPGTGFFYSNTGYNLLELLVEEVTGRGFSEYMHSEVFLPLGMKSATYAVDDAMAPYPPIGYNLGGKPVPVYVYPEKGSGGLFATAEDIALFATAGMRSNPVLSDESIRLLYAPEIFKIGIYGLVFDAYGLGHYIEVLPNGLRSVSHGGQGNGIMTHFQSVPETGDAFVILTNSQRSWPFISCLLSDWAEWRALPSVGMGRITWGRYGMSVLIGMLTSASLLIVLGLFTTFYRQKPSGGSRAFRVAAALFLLGVLIWCACQEYLFLTSVFPILSLWLGGSALVLSIALLFSSLLPVHFKGKDGKRRLP